MRRSIAAVVVVAALPAIALAGTGSAVPAVPAASEDGPGLTPVEGGASIDEATPVVAGRYVDSFPEDPEDVRVYSYERTIPGSVVNYGLTLLEPVAGASVLAPLLVPGASGEDPVRCGDVVRDPEVLPSAMPLSSYGGLSFLNRPRCVSADVVNIGVAPGEVRPPPPGTPYELVVWETPPPENQGDLGVPSFVGSDEFTTVPPEEVTQEVAPGVSRAEATVLPEGGTFHVDVPAGEVSWFAMEVPDGHLLAAEALAEDLERANQGAGVELRVTGPGGGFAGASELDAGNGIFDPVSGSVGTLGLEPVTVQTQTENVGPTAYTLIEDPVSARSNNDGLISTAGWYYLALYVQDLTGGGDLTLPTTLTAATYDLEPYLSSGPPQYDGAEPEALPGPESQEDAGPAPYDGAAAVRERRETLEDQQRAEARELEEAGEDRPVPTWAWVLGGAVVLVAGGLALLLGRRRARRGTTPPPGPGHRPGPRPGPPTPPTAIRPGPHPGGAAVPGPATHVRPQQPPPQQRPAQRPPWEPPQR